MKDKQSESRLAVTDDIKHEKPIGIECLRRSYVQSQLRWPLWPDRLKFDNPFSIMLRQAYEVDFNKRNVILTRAYNI